MTEPSPQVRVIYYSGICAALARQQDRLTVDISSAEEELDRARTEVKQARAIPAENASLD
jgi:hypothetical protein